MNFLVKYILQLYQKLLCNMYDIMAFVYSGEAGWAYNFFIAKLFLNGRAEVFCDMSGCYWV